MPASESQQISKAAPLTLPSENHYIGLWYDTNSRNFVISFFKISIVFSCKISDRFCCRDTPASTVKCPITLQNLKDLYNSLVKEASGTSGKSRSPSKKGDFWTAARKTTKTSYGQYIDKAKARLANHLKEPFQLAGAPPHIISGWNVSGKKETEDKKFDLRFTQTDLDEYKSLTAKSKDFMTTCTNTDARENLLHLLALDIRYLIICDYLGTFPPTAIPPEEVGNPAVLRDGDQDDDNSGNENSGDRRPTPPTPGKAKRSQDDNFTSWLPNSPDSIGWSDLGFTDEDASDRKNFVPACAFFFYIPELASKYVEVNNALHMHWHRKFKGPMKADDFKAAPHGFDDAEADWLSETIETMISKLNDDQRAERGLPVSAAADGQPRTAAVGGTARTKASQRAQEAAKKKKAEDAEAARKDGKKKEVEEAAKKAGKERAGAHMHSHPQTPLSK